MYILTYLYIFLDMQATFSLPVLFSSLRATTTTFQMYLMNVVDLCIASAANLQIT